MATLSELQADLKRLEANKNRGVASMTDARGRRVEYRTVKDIDAAIAGLKREINVLENTVPIRQVRIIAGKGL